MSERGVCKCGHEAELHIGDQGNDSYGVGKCCFPGCECKSFMLDTSGPELLEVEEKPKFQRREGTERRMHHFSTKYAVIWRDCPDGKWHGVLHACVETPIDGIDEDSMLSAPESGEMMLVTGRIKPMRNDIHSGDAYDVVLMGVEEPGWFKRKVAEWMGFRLDPAPIERMSIVVVIGECHKESE